MNDHKIMGASELEPERRQPAKRQTTLKIVCAWCEKDLGETDGGGVEGITSGICPECFAKEMLKLEDIKAFKRLLLTWLLRPRGAYPFVSYSGASLNARVELQFDFDDIAALFRTDELNIRGRVYTKANHFRDGNPVRR